MDQIAYLTARRDLTRLSEAPGWMDLCLNPLLSNASASSAM